MKVFLCALALILAGCNTTTSVTDYDLERGNALCAANGGTWRIWAGHATHTFECNNRGVFEVRSLYRPRIAP